MPSKVRIISQRNSAEWDDIVRALIGADAWGSEQTYYGIANQDRADKIRRAFRTAAKHQGIAVKAFWYECAGCDKGGKECQYHVSFTIYDPDEARRYKSRMAASATKTR